MSPVTRDKLVRFARGLRVPAAILVAYLITHGVFASLTEDDGLLTPESAPKLSVVIIGILAVVLRLAVVVALPPLLAWRVVRAWTDEA